MTKRHLTLDQQIFKASALLADFNRQALHAEQRLSATRLRVAAAEADNAEMKAECRRLEAQAADLAAECADVCEEAVRIHIRNEATSQEVERIERQRAEEISSRVKALQVRSQAEVPAA